MRFSRIFIGCVLAGAPTWSVAQPSAQRARYHLVITNGRSVGGTGAPWFRGDIAIAGDRIAAVRVVGDGGGAPTIDATNLIAKAMGKDPRDAAIDLVIADKGESSVITSIMNEDD